MRRLLLSARYHSIVKSTSSVVATASLPICYAVRYQSQAQKGNSVPYVDGELQDKYSSEKSYKKLNPATMPHYVRAKIQQDRKDIGLTEIDDWNVFAEDAVYMPTKSGPLWVGRDDPRCARYMARKQKMSEKPGQLTRRAPGVDPAMKLEDHPFRAYFSTPCNLNDRMSIAEGLFKAGYIKEYDIKFTAAKLKWKPRAPIVTIMGHVDHGKTTLLDSLRKTNVASCEAGGITQSIAAFSVKMPNSEDSITFVDTPGHQAFSEMRRAGVVGTDVVVLIVSVSDGVQPQTREVVELVKEHHVPCIVAINKIDKSNNTAPIIRELSALGVEFEEHGGDTQCVKISAIEGTGIDDLLEAIQLQAAMSELQTPDPSRAEVHVIDCKSPTSKSLVTGIVKCGSVKPGMTFAAGMTYATVPRITDEHGNTIREAKTATPVVLHGFKVLPKPGTTLMQLTNEAHGKRFHELMRDVFRTEGRREPYLQTLFAESNGNIYDRKPDHNNTRMFESKPFHLVCKAGTFGQLQALMSLVYEMPALPGINLQVRSTEVGGIEDSDIVMLNATQQPGAILTFGQTQSFNHVELPSHLQQFQFDVVYHGINWLKEQLVGMLPPVYEERVVATCGCIDTFKASKAGKGNAGGFLVHKGNIKATATVRVMRSPNKGEAPVKVFEGQMKELRRFKDTVPLVEEGLECGIILYDSFEFKKNDLLQEIEKVEVEQDVETVYYEAQMAEEELRKRRMIEEAQAASRAEENGADEAAEDGDDKQGKKVRHTANPRTVVA